MLCSSIGYNATDVLKMAEEVRPILADKSNKIRITKLTNILFQSIPHLEPPLPTKKNNQNQPNQ